MEERRLGKTNARNYASWTSISKSASDVRYRAYMLGLLTIILALNYVDRHVLAILLQDIKIDLSLSDTQLGLLTGIAFAFFYAIMGIPIARWADTGNRVTIIGVTTTLWSIMVVLSGMASNFIFLLLARVGVAVGEAGCMPPANSLIPEYFSRAERPRATAIYMLGTGLSIIIGFIGGGLLNELYGWRWTFILIGLPGIFLGILALLTLREPRLNREIETASLPESRNSSIKDVLAHLGKNSTFCHLVATVTIFIFFGNGIFLWLPSFFIRIHGMSTADVGVWMALVVGGASVIGIYFGGVLASRFAAGNEALQFKVMAIVVSAFSIISILTYLVPNKGIALLLMGLGILPATGVNGPLIASIQSLVDPKMRAMAIAILYFVANLIGLGFGPLAIGFISDSLVAEFGASSLKYALILFSPGYMWAGLHLWLASQRVEQDMQRL